MLFRSEKKSDFHADAWINFEDKNKPYMEIDIKEKEFPQRNLTKAKDKMNIIVFCFDAISRAQFFRSYPKTSKYLEKYFDDRQNKNLPSKGYQFFRG